MEKRECPLRVDTGRSSFPKAALAREHAISCVFLTPQARSNPLSVAITRSGTLCTE